jgi:hypothetical protein
VRNSQTVNMQSNSSTNVIVSCPAGTVVTGGGAQVSTSSGSVDAGSHIAASVPVLNNQTSIPGQTANGWGGSYTFANSGSYVLNTFALCQRVS